MGNPKHQMGAMDRCKELFVPNNSDRLKLLKIANIYAQPYNDKDGEDLLHDAFLKICSGDRNLPDDVNVVTGLANIMRSERSNFIEKQRRRAENFAAEVKNVDFGVISETVQDTQQKTPEELLIEKERETDFHQFLIQQCNGRETDATILEGKFRGLRGNELCEFAGINKGQLATVLKRIQRLFNSYNSKLKRS